MGAHDETIKSLAKTVAVLAGCLVTGFGGSAIYARTSTTAPPDAVKVAFDKPVTVKTDGPIMAELPPGQVELLKQSAEIKPILEGIRADNKRFWESYERDRVADRERYEQVTGLIGLINSKFAALERSVEFFSAMTQRHDDAIRSGTVRVGPGVEVRP